MTALMRWHGATADLRRSLYQDRYDQALAAIMAAREGKVKENKETETQRRKAHNQAQTYVVAELARLEEHNGVRNPLWDDPEWGPTQAERTPADELETLVAWLEAQQWSEFAQSLASQARSGKTLSDRQLAAARSMREKTEAKRKPTTVADHTRPTGIDLTGLVPGYYAVPGGDTRLKIKVDRPTKGKWEGWVFVSDGAAYGQRTRYGSQAPSGLYQGQIEDQLRSILEDPQEAQQQYGRLTGTCGVCGAQLEDEDSVARGIGPICATKWT